MDIVQQASNYKQLKKGANEGKCMRACRRPSDPLEGIVRLI